MLLTVYIYSLPPSILRASLQKPLLSQNPVQLLKRCLGDVVPTGVSKDKRIKFTTL
jgi:hypothetical protein